MPDFPKPPPEIPAVPLRARRDGWTPERQFAYLRTLAEFGHGGRAARAVGMSEQSACRLRRRSGAVAFNRLCEAAWGSAKQGLARERLARLRGGGSPSASREAETSKLMKLPIARIEPESSGFRPAGGISR